MILNDFFKSYHLGIYNNVHSGRQATAKSDTTGATELLVVNVRLVGSKDLKKQMKTVLDKVRVESSYWRLPVIFMGDLRYSVCLQVFVSLQFSGKQGGAL